MKKLSFFIILFLHFSTQALEYLSHQRYLHFSRGNSGKNAVFVDKERYFFASFTEPRRENAHIEISVQDKLFEHRKIIRITDRVSPKQIELFKWNENILLAVLDDADNKIYFYNLIKDTWVAKKFIHIEEQVESFRFQSFKNKTYLFLKSLEHKYFSLYLVEDQSKMKKINSFISQIPPLLFNQAKSVALVSEKSELQFLNSLSSKIETQFQLNTKIVSDLDILEFEGNTLRFSILKGDDGELELFEYKDNVFTKIETINLIHHIDSVNLLNLNSIEDKIYNPKAMALFFGRRYHPLSYFKLYKGNYRPYGIFQFLFNE